MPEDRFDLRELARSALADMPEPARAAFLAEILIELRGPQALELLSKVKTAVNLRMKDLINEKLPLDDLVAIYGGPAAVHARMAWPQSLKEEHGPAFVVAKSMLELETAELPDPALSPYGARSMMTAQEKFDLEHRLLFCTSQPWQELLEWLSDQQRTGWRFESDEEAVNYIGKLVLLIGDRQGMSMRREF